MEINWDEIGAALSAEMGIGEPSSSAAARRALEMLLGEDALRESVDYYVAGGLASELARSVLWLLKPWSAMLRCRELAQLPNKTATRRSAVELLRVVADRRALPWIPEFLADDDPDVQAWGIGVLNQLLFSDLVEPDEAEAVLEKAECHQNEAVRKCAERIRRSLR